MENINFWDFWFISLLEGFIADNEVARRDIAEKAMLIKGRAHVEFGELDKAVETFSTMTDRYPNSKDMASANFYIGYCCLLQGHFDRSGQAFDLIVRRYPQSTYADRARQYLTRIRHMTE